MKFSFKSFFDFVPKHIGYFAEDTFFLAMQHLHYLAVVGYKSPIANTILRTELGGDEDIYGIDFYVTTKSFTGDTVVIPLQFTTTADPRNRNLRIKLERAKRREIALVWPHGLSGRSFLVMLHGAARGKQAELQQLDGLFRFCCECYLGLRNPEEIDTV